MIKKYDFALNAYDCIQIEFALGLYIDECDEILNLCPNKHFFAARENANELRKCFKNYKTFESHE